MEESGITLREMLLCGAFQNKATASLDTDWLAALGKPEGDISALEFAELSEKSPDLFRTARIQGDHWTFDFHDLLGREPGTGAENLTAYLACNLISEGEREAWLFLGADDEVNIWLNGKQVFSRKGSRSLSTYEKAVKVRLGEGDNFLLVKVANISGGWGFTGRIEVAGDHAAITALNRGAHLLREAVISATQPLQLFSEDLPITLSTDGICVDVREKRSVPISFVDGLEANAKQRSPGLYKVQINLLGGEVNQYFIVGDLATIQSAMETELDAASLDENTRIGLETYIARIGIIREAAERNRTVNEWDRTILTGDLGYKAVYAARSFQEAIARVEAGNAAFKDVHGLSLRAFRSKIDDQVNHYRLYVPTTYERKKAPLGLIVVMHPIFSVPRRFIEGVVVANHDEAERWSRVAERLGIGVLWAGYRVCPYGNPIEATHLEEVLDSVAKDYDIDRDRIGLYGECSGALGAALAVRSNPARYSGILFLNPVLKRLKNRMDDNGLFATFSGFNAWMSEQDPIALLSRHPIPINMVHDGTDPAHGPLDHSLAFAGAVEEAGKKIIFERPKAPAGEWFETTLVPRLEWLAAQRRSYASSPEQSPMRKVGPISALLAERFVLVIPSQGTPEERTAGLVLADAFQQAWMRTNFGRCRAIFDHELTEEDEATSNLVLIGSPACNSVWKRFEKSLLVQTRENGLQIGADYVQLNEVGIQAWCPHPLVAGKRILLIGGYSAQGQRFGTMELALDGWYDFAIWKQNVPRPVLLAADRYSSLLR